MLRDSKTGRPINGFVDGEENDDDANTVCTYLSVSLLPFGMGELTADVLFIAGYSFFDSGDVALVGPRKRSQYYNVGE